MALKQKNEMKHATLEVNPTRIHFSSPLRIRLIQQYDMFFRGQSWCIYTVIYNVYYFFFYTHNE